MVGAWVYGAEALSRVYQAPPTDLKLVADVPVGQVPKRVILVIGDGMGEGARALTSLVLHGATNQLTMDRLPVRGVCVTKSANAAITDSAAAATAISTGQKVNNGALAMTPEGKKLCSVATMAHRKGRSVGILTSDPLYGATPAGFFAHRPARSQSAEIIAESVESGYEVILSDAASAVHFTPPLKEALKAKGCAYVEDEKAFLDVPTNQCIMAQIARKDLCDSDDLLGRFAFATMRRLSADPDGFFMMVESTYPDHGGHNNHLDETVMGVVHADWVVYYALKFAIEQGDTLVICTADHETGGLEVGALAPGEKVPAHTYHSRGHTAVNVPLTAYGPGSEHFQGEMDNTAIGQRLAELWGFRLPTDFE